MANRGGSGRGWVRWIVGIVLAVVILLIVAVFVGPMLIPADAIRARVTSAVHDATGRDLDIKGGLAVSVFPTLGVTAKDVTFSNATWASGRPMVTLSRLDIRLELIPLISGNVRVSSFVLEKPDIDLETDKNGIGNWVFAPAAPAAATPGTNAPAANAPAKPAPAAGGGGASPINGIALGDVHITDGHVAYRNGVTGKTETADAINLKVSLPDMDSPLAVDGSVHWHDKTVQLGIGAAKPRELMYGAGSSFQIKLDTDPVKLSFTGTMGLAGQPKGNGDLDLSVPSVRGLVAWATGQPLSMPGDGMGPLAIKGKVSIDGAKYALAGVQLGLDAMKATADFAVDTGGARPSLKGKLAVDKLDLNHYMAPEGNGTAAPQPAAAKSAAAPAPAAKPAGAPQAGAKSGWSDDPIDASGLKAADVDLGLSADAIVYRKVVIGKTAVQVKLDNGRLTLDLADMVLYQGNVTGRVQVDGTAPQLATDANLKIAKVQVGPLMLALAESDRVTGAVDSDSQITSRGKSQRELVGALNGKGNFALKDGVIKGVDLVGMIKDAATSVVGGKSGETSFSTASGTYTITNGILKNGDLVVTAPTFSVTGAGTVDMPKQTVDYKVKATAVGLLTVPVNVTGPWDAIDYSPDLKGILLENVGNAGKLVGSGVKGAAGTAGSVGGALGGAVKGGLGKLLGN